MLNVSMNVCISWALIDILVSLFAIWLLKQLKILRKYSTHHIKYSDKGRNEPWEKTSLCCNFLKDFLKNTWTMIINFIVYVDVLTKTHYLIFVFMMTKLQETMNQTFKK